VDSQDGRIAKRLAEIRTQEQQLDREPVDRERSGADLGAQVVAPREGSAGRSAVFLLCVVVLTAVLLGAAVTFDRLSGKNIADAKRTGRAAVTSCVKHGPVTNHGFGYWERCLATITWDDGLTNRVTVDVVFTSADIGRHVRVGDLGNYGSGKQLARADVTPRPWLAWIGYAAGILAIVPGIIVVLLLRELLRFRRGR
jgi:Family of unknown function (DUF6346)